MRTKAASSDGIAGSADAGAEGAALGAKEEEVLFLTTTLTKMINPTIISTTIAGDVSFFLGTTTDFGLPQCGQLGALGDISLPQSGHFTRGMAWVSGAYTVLAWTPPDLRDKSSRAGIEVRLQSYIRPLVQI
jgi:hypothetical protein